MAALVATATRFGEALRQGQARVFDPVRVGVLQAVAARGPVRPGAVAEELDVLPSSVTRHVQALVELGYLVVATDPNDRRASLIETTDAGRDELRRFMDVGVDVFAAVVTDWPAADITTLTTLLDRLLADWARNGPDQQRAAQARQRFAWSET